jgi:hypothetical protein
MGDEIKRAELAASAKKINDKLGAAAIAKRWEEIFDAIVEKKA